MGSLSTVEPERSGFVVDGDGPLREDIGTLGDELIARIDTVGLSYARVVEGGLSDRVILGHELEGNDIASLGRNASRLEEEAGILANGDNESLRKDGRQGRSQESKSSTSRESHFA